MTDTGASELLKGDVDFNKYEKMDPPKLPRSQEHERNIQQTYSTMVREILASGGERTAYDIIIKTAADFAEAKKKGSLTDDNYDIVLKKLQDALNCYKQEDYGGVYKILEYACRLMQI